MTNSSKLVDKADLTEQQQLMVKTMNGAIASLSLTFRAPVYVLADLPPLFEDLAKQRTVPPQLCLVAILLPDQWARADVAFPAMTSGHLTAYGTTLLRPLWLVPVWWVRTPDGGVLNMLIRGLVASPDFLNESPFRYCKVSDRPDAATLAFLKEREEEQKKGTE